MNLVCYLHPQEMRSVVEAEILRQIENGTFAWAVRQNIPVILPPLHDKISGEILLCPLATENRVLGMFLGILGSKKEQVYQETLDLLSIALLSTSLGLENAMLYREVKDHNKTLEKQEDDLRRSNENLRMAMEATIEIVSTMAEIRDPYTADHQRRVARLALDISNELGFPEEQREGVRIASLVHDIGKVQVPSEILSKPGRLTRIEFMLIKTHPQVGYDILRTIQFPWPVADIVAQHHERLDGSGYPLGLKKDEILAEARILGVADVVEAIATHRPYRPALGIDKALEEIVEGKGILYDAGVVDACCQLFAK